MLVEQLVVEPISNLAFWVVIKSIMGSILAELSLDMIPTYVPKSISNFLRELAFIGNPSQKACKLHDFIRRLEDEMRKIDAFKRELPLCMLLIKDAIQVLKEESMEVPARSVPPVVEEFVPLLNKNEEEDKEKDYREDKERDKMNWMSSVQLWKSDSHKQATVVEVKLRNEGENNRTATKDPSEICKINAEGRTFLPYKGHSSFPAHQSPRTEGKEDVPLSVLSLVTPGATNKILREEPGSNGSLGSKPVCNGVVSSCTPNPKFSLRNPSQQNSRKQRRCWSPELHRRFVSALQQLGGSQVATPKQIRELMQVDGLTNDEVKSHLQKYRLHTRRVPPAASTPPNQPVVVLGGLWMSQDQYGDSSKASSSQSGSPQGPLQLARNVGGTSGGDSMGDEDDDDKSESYGWKSRIHNDREEDDV